MFIPAMLLGIAAYLFLNAFTSRQNSIAKVAGGVLLTTVGCLGIYMDFKVAQIEHRKAQQTQSVATL